MNTAAIFDLDGTLVELPSKSWTKEEFTWPNFLSEMDEQKGIKVTIGELRHHILSERLVYVVTARPESYREETEALLKKHGIVYDQLIMRTDEEVEREAKLIAICEDYNEIKGVLFSQHVLYRERIARELRDNNVRVDYAYDDQIPNLEVWSAYGASTYFVTPAGKLAPITKFN